MAATGVFYRQERAVALELLEARLRDGRSSGYSFVFAERRGELVGYCAWGRVPLTRRTLRSLLDRRGAAGRGAGPRPGAAVAASSGTLAARGGGRLYIETSSRRAYERTRRFYRDVGYRQVARLRDFYAPGDHKVMFCKVIRRARLAAERGPFRAPAAP